MSAAIAQGIGVAGASMALGGVVQMLSPQAGGLRMRQGAENKPSYAFGGPVNTTAQGNPVGVLYGTREIGGAIISAGIYTEDQQ
jgi:predicted phage tail protein